MGITTPTSTENMISISSDLIQKLYDSVTESSFRSSGAGSYHSTWQIITSQFDKLGYNPLPPNHEVTGLTFFTRPKLNLTTTSLRQDRVMTTLDSLDPVSFPFSIRCYLDSKLAQSNKYDGIPTFSPFHNSESPFIVPLTNCLQTISGFPSFTIDTETTEGGFFGEDQTYAKGSDFNMRTYDLSVTFRDFQGGYVMAMMLYWLRYIGLVKWGVMTAYDEDIFARRLNYTCSIYRFILDPSRRYITKWSKATGCFPHDLPIGAAFDIPMRENYIHAVQDFSIPFTANTVEYMDPIIFKDFNTLVTRWAGDLSLVSNTNRTSRSGRVAAVMDSSTNFAGIPWIDVENGTNELLWMAYPEELTDPAATVIQDVTNQVQAQISNNLATINSYSGQSSLYI